MTSERGARRCLFGAPDSVLLHQQLQDLQVADELRARERFGLELAALGCEPLQEDEGPPSPESASEATDTDDGEEEPQAPTEPREQRDPGSDAAAPEEDQQ